MNRPTWATAIGIIMIAFGGCSALNNLQSINLPEKLDKARTAIEQERNNDLTLGDTTLSSEQRSASPETSQATKTEKELKVEEAEKALTMSETIKTWIVRFGYIGMFVALLYILAGIFLLIPKKISIPLTYSALVVGIAFSATKTIVLTSAGASSGAIALTMGATQLFSILADIVLLSIIFSSDKEYYLS